MLLNLNRMKKTKIIWLANHRCKHHIPYIQHPNCYFLENPEIEKLGFIDIETTNLHADFGIVLCYAIADNGTDEILNRVITKKELATCLDKKVLEQCIKDMKKFNRLIGYYSSNFDIPFLRSRAVTLGLTDFPEIGEIIHNDLYYVIRNKFRLSRNRLDNACKTLLGSTEKTRIEAEYWIKALQGDPESLAYIEDHNKKDTTELKRLYEKVAGFKRIADTSI